MAASPPTRAAPCTHGAQGFPSQHIRPHQHGDLSARSGAPWMARVATPNSVPKPDSLAALPPSHAVPARMAREPAPGRTLDPK